MRTNDQEEFARERVELVALGRAVRRMRERYAIGVDELAARIGVQPPYAEALEAGRVDPGYKLLRNLGRALGEGSAAPLMLAEEEQARESASVSPGCCGERGVSG